MSLSSIPLYANIHLSYRSQIAGLIAKEALRKVFNKYINFADVFFPDLIFKLSKHTRINNHTIKLIDGQQPPYRPIYSLGPMKLKTLKDYIEINLANGFIRPSNLLADTFILFNQKSDESLWLCINYRGLNNFAIKN